MCPALCPVAMKSHLIISTIKTHFQLGGRSSSISLPPLQKSTALDSCIVFSYGRSLDFLLLCAKLRNKLGGIWQHGTWPAVAPQGLRVFKSYSVYSFCWPPPPAVILPSQARMLPSLSVMLPLYLCLALALSSSLSLWHL